MKIVIATDRRQPNERYRGALLCAGALPEEVVLAVPGEKLPEEFDGLLLAGGPDVEPSRFGETVSAPRVEVRPERDSLDFRLLAKALERRIPVFGICRGHQVLNVALGGTLWQDLPSQRDRGVVHGSETEDVRAPEHPVRAAAAAAAGTPFARAVAAAGTVASRHHQAVKDLAPSLVPLAASPDDLVEAFERRGDPFCAAVQWHPEDAVARPEQKRLFTVFLEACRAHAAAASRREAAPIEVLLEGLVPVVRLNRPAARNAFSTAMAEMLAGTIEALGKDPTVSAIVLTGAGGAFSSGGDLDVMWALADAGDVDGFRDLLLAGGRAVIAMAEAPRPVLAALDGAAAGGGLSLALAADVRVASSAAGCAAFFLPSYTAVGLVPAWGATFHLPLRLGHGGAADAVFAAGRIDAARAREIGLVDLLVDEGPSLPAAVARASDYAERSLPALAAAKRLLGAERLPRLTAALAREVEAQIELFRSGELLGRLPVPGADRTDEQETS
jgi:putative glutamine amidotransferase